MRRLFIAIQTQWRTGGVVDEPVARSKSVMLVSPRQWSCATVIASLMWLVPAPAPQAHAILIESVPPAEASVSAPPRLVLKFNSKVEARLSSVMLVGGARNTRMLLSSPPGPNTETLIYALPELSPGQYRAEWKALSIDGHVTDGVLRFTVIEAPR
jgi:copper resistance protein C